MAKTNRAARLAEISKTLGAIPDIGFHFTESALEVSGERPCVNHALDVLGLETTDPTSDEDDAHWTVRNRRGEVVGTYYAHDESAEFTVRTRRAA